jgi:hypothetical protein
MKVFLLSLLFLVQSGLHSAVIAEDFRNKRTRKILEERVKNNDTTGNEADGHSRLRGFTQAKSNELSVFGSVNEKVCGKSIVIVIVSLLRSREAECCEIPD